MKFRNSARSRWSAERYSSRSRWSVLEGRGRGGRLRLARALAGAVGRDRAARLDPRQLLARKLGLAAREVALADQPLDLRRQPRRRDVDRGGALLGARGSIHLGLFPAQLYR